MRANFVLSSVAGGIRRNATMTVALVLNTAIALLFVGGIVLASAEASRFQKTYESKINVSVYLCTPYAYDTQIQTRQGQASAGQKQRTITCQKNQATSTQRRIEIGKLIQADPRVARIDYISTKQALDNAKKINLEGVKSLKVGDLPDSFTVFLKNVKKDYTPFANAFANVQGVDQVFNQFSSIKVVLDTIDGFRLASIVLAGIVLFASVLLIGNTVLVAAAQRKNETSIMRLVGASRWMTELPFILETLVATFVGGLIAIGLLAAGKLYVLEGIFKFQVEHGTIPNLGTNDLLLAGGAGMAVGLVLAAITAFTTLRLIVRL